MSDSIIEAIDAALAVLPEDSAAAYELAQLREMFAPYPGDSLDDASTRSLMHAKCGNCGETWPMMSTPSPLPRVSLCAIRHTQCPRCFNTQTVYLHST